MVEVVFVISIVGVLAGVAMPKMVGTRDNAKASVAVHDLQQCITDLGAHYIATDTEAAGNGANDSYACRKVAENNCFVIQNTDASDGAVNTRNNSANTDSWCSEAQTLARQAHLSPKRFIFKGTRVVY
jgi:type II secretory pathway pseudopilin PulG